MALGDLASMPNTRALIGDQGATFDNYFVNSSVCCPSRATTLRGQYEHNTGVLSNGGSNGGFEKAYRSGIERDTIATHLQHAGYQTGLFGKYLNGYPNGAPETYVPPGWTDWASPVRGNAYGEYDYTLNENHVLHEYGHSAGAYGTDVYVGLADQFIRRRERRGISVLRVRLRVRTARAGDARAHRRGRVPRRAGATHRRVQPGRRHRDAEVRQQPPAPDARRDRPRSTRCSGFGSSRSRPSTAGWQRSSRRCAPRTTSPTPTSSSRRTTASTSGSTASLRASSPRTTPTSACRCSSAARGSRPAGTCGALAGNVDLTATFAAMAGIKPPSFSDGRSLVAAAQGRLRAGTPNGRTAHGWRQAYLVEHRNVTGVSNPPRARNKQHLPLEPNDPDQVSTDDGCGRQAPRPHQHGE